MFIPDPDFYPFRIPVPKFIDPVFVKTSPKRSFSVIQNERFGLVFVKTGSIISGTDLGSKNSNTEMGEKKFVVNPSFVATNFTKLKIILFFKC